MYPLDFEEYVTALGVKKEIVAHVRERLKDEKPVDPIVHEKFKGLFRSYLVVGGMPAAVDTYIRTKNIAKVVDVQKGILVEYRKDAAKYDKAQRLKIVRTLELIPEELNRRNKRFIVSDLKDGTRYDREEDSFLWLTEAGIGLGVCAVNEPKVPLRLTRRSGFFKLFMNDVGLLSALYMDGIQYRILSEETDVNFGAVYENFVAQELTAHGFPLYYFLSNDGLGEVDFLIEKDGRVLPIEVKSGKSYKTHASLDEMMEVREYALERAIVVSNANCSQGVDARVRYLPVYYLMFLDHDGLPEGATFDVKLPLDSDLVFGKV